MPETSLAVDHLFTFTGTIGRGMTVKAGPVGTRVIVPVLQAKFDGQKLRGKVAGDAPAGDWVYSRADGSIKLDVRVTLLTDDGAVILMTYSGIGVPNAEAMVLRTARPLSAEPRQYQG
jgi:uncharacterized protein DUF3237